MCYICGCYTRQGWLAVVQWITLQSDKRKVGSSSPSHNTISNNQMQTSKKNLHFSISIKKVFKLQTPGPYGFFHVRNGAQETGLILRRRRPPWLLPESARLRKFPSATLDKNQKTSSPIAFSEQSFRGQQLWT